VLRVDADPTKAYIDGRIEGFLDIIEKLAMHLKTHQKETWDQLLKYVVAIFVKVEKVAVEEYKEWAATNVTHSGEQE